MRVGAKRSTTSLKLKKQKNTAKNILINCILMIFILFVLILQGIDNHEKCLIFAFYENRIKHTNVLSPFNTRPHFNMFAQNAGILNMSIQQVIGIGSDMWCMFATVKTWIALQYSDLASLQGSIMRTVRHTNKQDFLESIPPADVFLYATAVIPSWK